MIFGHFVCAGQLVIFCGKFFLKKVRSLNLLILENFVVLAVLSIFFIFRHLSIFGHYRSNFAHIF